MEARVLTTPRTWRVRLLYFHTAPSSTMPRPKHVVICRSVPSDGDQRPTTANHVARGEAKLGLPESNSPSGWQAPRPCGSYFASSAAFVRRCAVRVRIPLSRSTREDHNLYKPQILVVINYDVGPIVVGFLYLNFRCLVYRSNT